MADILSQRHESSNPAATLEPHPHDMATFRVANSHAGPTGEVAAVGYVRVSTQDQATTEKTSLPLQRKAITRYCKDHNLKLLKIYEDPGRSGATIERPALQYLVVNSAAFESAIPTETNGTLMAPRTEGESDIERIDIVKSKQSAPAKETISHDF